MTDIRARVLKRDGYRCRYCHTQLAPDEVTYDHVVPKCRGGRETANNLVVACKPCNGSKGDSDLSDWFAWRSGGDSASGPLTQAVAGMWPQSARQLDQRWGPKAEWPATERGTWKPDAEAI